MAYLDQKRPGEDSLKGAYGTMAKLMETAMRVNSLLTAYIAIHDDIFRTSIRKLIPIPGIFKKTDYCQHKVLLAQISSQLQECEGETVVSSLNGGPDSHLADVLAQYVRALNATVTHFQQMTDLLCRKAQGEQGYSIDLYNRDCDRYNQLVQQYKQVGDSLNQIVRGR